jgi:hypothetical protein
MDRFPEDIYTEPTGIDVNTLANLGPLAPLAGVWEGTKGVDVKPKAAGPKSQDYVERIAMEPIDPVTNGPQLLYGLRYHTHITKPGQIKTYHEQVGYWLWEPATGLLTHSLTIPRGQVLLATGRAEAGARMFEVAAESGSVPNGIAATPFLDHAFRTQSFRIAVTVHDDGSWSYEEDTVLIIKGRDEPFHHTDANRLVRVAPPTPNPLARPAG